ncbi:F0F1 ATP synthase subunit A [Aquipuribacter sp. MA13-6]|uniref:F0F1 ATP synthase subunit A n=1 Tax=unclassified Aquipuribacter TaxID=2635084 RepID=UPI003EEEF29C
MLIRLFVLVVLVVLFTLYARRARLVSGRFTGTIELLLDFVRVQVAENILGKKDGRKFFPLLATIFFLVLGLNITGVIPAINLAGTSRIGMPLVLALVAYGTFIVVGIMTSGFLGYFKASLFPPNVPWPLYIIVTPIELISTFVARPFSLTIRLLANMIAGHLLLVLCFSATNYLFLQLIEGNAVGAIGVVTLFGGFAFTLFEILVAALQAYIFALLTAVYISGSLHPEH